MEHRQPVGSGGGLSAQAVFSAPAVAPDEALWVRLGAEGNARAVVPGDMFRATTGSGTAGVRLASGDGMELVVEPGGALRVVEAAATKRFTLMLGAVRIHVRRLRSGERFLIDTPEAEVEVHGTRFRVTRADAATGAASGAAMGAATGLGPSRCGGAASTVVSVSEGVVSVAGAGRVVRVSPGETWSSSCPTPEAAPSTSPLASSTAGPRASAESARPPWLHRRHPPASTQTPSRLAAQNDLFEDAARARRQGHPSQALELFERFAETYPDSSLLESALIQRMRLLATSGATGAAAQAATRYLDRFPDGFARTEAEHTPGVAGGLAPAPSVSSPNRAR